MAEEPRNDAGRHGHAAVVDLLFGGGAATDGPSPRSRLPTRGKERRRQRKKETAGARGSTGEEMIERERHEDATRRDAMGSDAAIVGAGLPTLSADPPAAASSMGDPARSAGGVRPRNRELYYDVKTDAVTDCKDVTLGDPAVSVVVCVSVTSVTTKDGGLIDEYSQVSQHACEEEEEEEEEEEGVGTAHEAADATETASSNIDPEDGTAADSPLTITVRRPAEARVPRGDECESRRRQRPPVCFRRCRGRGSGAAATTRT